MRKTKMETPAIPEPLEPVEMHAPIEVHVKIYASADGKTVSVMEAVMPPGRYPSIDQMRSMVDTALTPEDAAAGGRLLLKPEFIAHITKRETGIAMAVKGDQHFIAPPVLVPHQMLVHAICGAGFGKGGYATPIEMTERGLATFTGNQWNENWEWDRAALDKLPDHILLGIYERVTA